MRKFTTLLISFCFIFGILAAFVVFEPFVQAGVDEELREIEEQIADLSEKLDLSKAATAPLESELFDLNEKINGLKARIDQIAYDLEVKRKRISQHEQELSHQMEVFASAARSFYIRSHLDFPLMTLISGDLASEASRELFFQSQTAKKDREIIISISEKIAKLSEDRKSLESERSRLASARKTLDERASFLAEEIGEARAYQGELESEIAGLSAKQQELLAQKTGTFQTSVGEVPPADDPASRPDYDPGFSPAFAAFSFGAPHRVGMSQYGAFGRSKQGKSAEDILKAYYSGVEINKSYSVPGNITVDGYGSIPFEDEYLKGIGEMPTKWGDEGGYEALKAQAIAARTYALAVTNNGQGSICAGESCQVYIGHNKGGKWEQAVNDTKGWVIVSGGQPIKAWYSSTTGGFTRSSAAVWGKDTPYAQGIVDTTCGGIGCWTDGAYEKIAGSPWFYKSWYKTRSGFSCGRSHPWLTQDEFSDILNAAIVAKNDSGAVSHLSQIDAKECWNKDLDTWDHSRVRDEASKHGGPISSISSVSVSYAENGITSSVTFSTDKGSFSFSGSDFKTIFNLRAPSAIYLQSLLFNIEKK